MSNETLYERLGGTTGIHAIVDDVVARHMTNPVVSARFRPYVETPDRLKVIKQHTVDFFSAGSGGPAQYTGRTMRDAHRGMNISEAEYVAVVDDILDALRARSIDDATQKDVLAIAYSLKGEILHV